MSNRLRRIVLCSAFWCSFLYATVAAQEGPSATGEVGTIAGTVLDKTSGDPIIEAGVEIVGQNKKTRTDLDGKYRLKMPPGTYEVRIFAPLYQSVRFPKVVVKANEVRNLDAGLAAAGQAGVEVVEVVAQADRAAEATQLLQRKNAPVVSDTISAEVIKKTPGGDAADIVQRAPAVTVKDDKFIFVRGLNERYSNALLNGSRLPSTDPQRKVVPLDLFPADFLESLSVVKSYTPDLPGDFAGGLADLRLRDFPEKFTLGLGASTGGNTQSTFQDFTTYEGAGYLDDLGFGNDFRQIPVVVPGYFNSLRDAKRFAAARSFKNIWQTKTVEAPPNFGANFTVGDSYGPLGFQLAGVYSNEYKHRNEVQRQFNQGGTEERPIFIVDDDFRYDVSTYQTKLGGIFTSAYKLGDAHKLTLRSLINRNSTDETQFGSGRTSNLPGNFVQQQTRLRYTEEELVFGQLAGEHHLFPWLNLDWRTALARTTQDEPDTRHTTYQGPRDGPLVFVEDSSGGVRVFNELKERMTDSAVDLTVPFKTGLPFTDVWSGLPAKFKAGAAYTFREHDFNQRRFRFRPNAGSFDLSLPPEELLQPGNIGPGGVDVIETTVPLDTFEATQEIRGWYGMIELPLVRDRLRVVGGARVEYSLIRISFFDQLGEMQQLNKRSLDPLPSANLIYSPRDDMNVRLGYSRSVTRPEFRELSPVQYPAPRGLRPLVGNPDLVQAEIESYDIRWEWFFSPLELVSLSLFQKEITNPIEQVVIAQASNRADSFFNGEKAEIMGIELETRKDGGFIWSPLKNLSLLTNFTYALSELQAPRTSRFQVQTSTDRDLQGQAPYIVNAALDYTHPKWGSIRGLYNTAGRRISVAGSDFLPDIYEERRDQVDMVLIFPLKELVGLPLTAKLSAENITNTPIKFTQGPEVQRRYTSGVKFGLGLSYSY
jgi:hypothetical protein